MTEKPYTHAMFESLVFDEEGEPVEVAYIGPEAHYVILDGDFRRHVEARAIDRQVVDWLKAQIDANKELVTQGMMNMLGKDDLFTKAMIDSSIKNVDQIMEYGLPEDARMMLGMMGFKVIVNIHGEVVRIEAPAQEMPGDYD
ncbi:MAG: hypothetical protein D6796_11200 [Caldilineae bacterium]|nr:MAG: hypothetical protein D6796_11200 [Caldilineae bacterium]